MLSMIGSWYDHYRCLSGKESTLTTGGTEDMGSIPGLGKSLGGGNGKPLQYSCLGNPTDRVACCSPLGCKQLDRTEHTHTLNPHLFLLPKGNYYQGFQPSSFC